MVVVCINWTFCWSDTVFISLMQCFFVELRSCGNLRFIWDTNLPLLILEKNFCLCDLSCKIIWLPKTLTSVIESLLSFKVSSSPSDTSHKPFIFNWSAVFSKDCKFLRKSVRWTDENEISRSRAGEISYIKASELYSRIFQNWSHIWPNLAFQDLFSSREKMIMISNF